MKKILFLGGAAHQVPALQYAKAQGYYTILCDYLVDNLGKFYADEFHNVSTMDQEAILEIAVQESIDGIIAYASDSALATAAYVAEKMNLPSYSPETVSVLSNKKLFREFLTNNGFNAPKSKSFTTIQGAEKELRNFNFPLIVKPVDSGGSRGITSINHISELEQAFEDALAMSTKRMVIVEEFIEMSTAYTVGGDVIVLDGEIKYFGILNGHRDVENNRCIPLGNSYPTFLDDGKSQLARAEIQKVIDILGIEFGALNIDIVFDTNEQPYIIEINARNGANMVSELLEKATNVNLVGLSVEMAMNNVKHDFPELATETFYATYYLRTYQKGRLECIGFDREIKKNIIKKVMYKSCGDEVEPFDGLDKIIGILLLKFKDLDELKRKMKHMDRYIDVKVLSYSMI